MAVADYLKSGWYYKTVTITKDAGGAKVNTYGAKVTFNGFVQRLGANEQRRYGKESVLSTHKVFTDAGCKVSENDALFDPDNREYRVLYVDNVNRLSHHIEIECELVR